MIEFFFGVFCGVIITIACYEYIKLEKHKSKTKEEELIDKITADLMERIQDIEKQIKEIKNDNTTN